MINHELLRILSDALMLRERVFRIEPYTLPVYMCCCGELQIHNWSELKAVEQNEGFIRVERACRGCGWIYSRGYRKSAGRVRARRLICWLSLWWDLHIFVSKSLPSWMGDGVWRTGFKVKLLFSWLERWVPV